MVPPGGGGKRGRERITVLQLSQKAQENSFGLFARLKAQAKCAQSPEETVWERPTPGSTGVCIPQ